MYSPQRRIQIALALRDQRLPYRNNLPLDFRLRIYDGLSAHLLHPF